jgi:hypothetical protein
MITKRERNKKFFRDEYSTLSWAVLLITPKMFSMQMATSKVENSAQVSSSWLKFVHGLISDVFYASAKSALRDLEMSYLFKFADHQKALK